MTVRGPVAFVGVLVRRAARCPALLVWPGWTTDPLHARCGSRILRSTGHALVKLRRRRCDVRQHHQMSNMSVDSEIKESQ